MYMQQGDIRIASDVAANLIKIRPGNSNLDERILHLNIIIYTYFLMCIA